MSDQPQNQLSNQELLDILLPEVRRIGAMSQENSVTLATVTEQLAQLAKVTDRLDKAIYGNGKPGLRALVEVTRGVSEQQRLRVG